jgi:hypothetical protein
MKRVMCIYLPAWPLQRLWHVRPELRDRVIALYDPHAARGSRVVLCSVIVESPESRVESQKVNGRGRRAEGQKSTGPQPSTLNPQLLPGMPLAEALAIEPDLYVERYDPEADLHALGRLAEWAGRFSPIVALEEDLWLSTLDPGAPGLRSSRPSSLLLDITGCAACFNGEEKLLERAIRELREQGWQARVAIADTVGGAWGLAHYGQTPYGEKGVGNLLCEAPIGPFRQKVPDPNGTAASAI